MGLEGVFFVFLIFGHEEFLPCPPCPPPPPGQAHMYSMTSTLKDPIGGGDMTVFLGRGQYYLL